MNWSIVGFVFVVPIALLFIAATAEVAYDAVWRHRPRRQVTPKPTVDTSAVAHLNEYQFGRKLDTHLVKQDIHRNAVVTRRLLRDDFDQADHLDSPAD